MPVHADDLTPAPDELLKVIRCNCYTDCSTLKCTCWKHNVKCSPAVITAEDLAAQTLTIFILMTEPMNFLIKKTFFILFVTQIVL